MSENLFLRAHNTTDLEFFAELLWPILCVDTGEIRESSNYVEHKYIMGKRRGVVFKLAKNDESELGDFDYWLNISKDSTHDEADCSMDEFVDMLARKLATAGYQVSRVLDFGSMPTTIVDYQIEPAPDGNSIITASRRELP